MTGRALPSGWWKQGKKAGAPKRASALKHSITIPVPGGRRAVVTVRFTDEGLDQYNTAEWLRLHRIKFLHIPNERKSSPQEGLMMKLLGLEPGASDLLIFTPPPRFPNAPGVAMEMKSKARQKKDGTARSGAVSDDQTEWLAGMDALGWVTRVAFGFDDAIKFLTWLGYGVRRY